MKLLLLAITAAAVAVWAYPIIGAVGLAAAAISGMSMATAIHRI